MTLNEPNHSSDRIRPACWLQSHWHWINRDLLISVKQVSGLFYYDTAANRSTVFRLLANQEAASAWCGCEVRCMFVKLFYDRHRREETTRQECLKPKDKKKYFRLQRYDEVSFSLIAGVPCSLNVCLMLSECSLNAQSQSEVNLMSSWSHPEVILK